MNKDHLAAHGVKLPAIGDTRKVRTRCGRLVPSIDIYLQSFADYAPMNASRAKEVFRDKAIYYCQSCARTLDL